MAGADISAILLLLIGLLESYYLIGAPRLHLERDEWREMRYILVVVWALLVCILCAVIMI